MIKLVMFDFDGVIEDNYELHFQMSEKKTRGITREEHRKLFEGNIHVEREKLKDRDTGYDLRQHFADSKKTQVIREDVKKMLKELAGNYSLGIISSGNEAGMKEYLHNNQIQDLFSFLYGYETNKIKVNKFEKALKDFNIKNDECIFVTDTLGDILEAREVGIKSIAIDFGFHERERLEKGNPVAVVSNFGELVLEIKNL